MLCNKLLRITKSFIKPSVCYSSKLIQKDSAEQILIRQTLAKNLKPTNSEWHELRKKLTLSAQNEASNNIDETVLRSCFSNQLDVGKSYMQYLTESGSDPKPATTIALLDLYYRASINGTVFTDSDQRDITDLLVLLQPNLTDLLITLTTLADAKIYAKNCRLLTV